MYVCVSSGSGSTSSAVDDSWFHDVEKANADTAPETIAKVPITYIHTYICIHK